MRVCERENENENEKLGKDEFSKRANYVPCIYDWSVALLVCVWIYEIARRDIDINININIETHRSTFGRAKNMDYFGKLLI